MTAAFRSCVAREGLWGRVWCEMRRQALPKTRPNLAHELGLTYFLPIFSARLISRTSLCAPNPPLCAVAAIMVRSHEPLAMHTPGARWPGPLWVPCGLRVRFGRNQVSLMAIHCH